MLRNCESMLHDESLPWQKSPLIFAVGNMVKVVANSYSGYGLTFVLIHVLKAPKIVNFGNSVNLDEAAHPKIYCLYSVDERLSEFCSCKF